MKVTVDTRHDSLEEALATVHAAFGSTPTQPVSAAARRNPQHRRSHAPRSQASRIPQGAAAGPGTKRSPARARRGLSAPAVDVPAAPAWTHAAAPSAETPLRPVPAKKAAKAPQGCRRRRLPRHRALQEAPAKKRAARNGTKSTSSINPTSNIAPPGQADAIRAWAKTQGMQVKQAGRLPAAVIQAYQASPDH